MCSLKPECEQELKHDMQKIVKLWRTLQQPFTLPASSLGYHECRWERLDLDVLACAGKSCVGKNVNVGT